MLRQSRNGRPEICTIHIELGAEIPSTASPFFSTCPAATTSAKPRALQCRVVDQESFRIIVTVEFLGQILEIERHLMRSGIARGSSQFVGEVGDPAQQCCLVRTDQR